MVVFDVNFPGGVGTPRENRPVITSNSGELIADVEVPENTTAVTTVTATDADGDALVYSISAGGDSALFQIDPITGVLAFIAPPDLESQVRDTFYVAVRASDGTLFDTQILSIDIVNQPGVTITGTTGDDIIDATHTVAGQASPTDEEDTIHGKGGDDRISALGGSDRITGGRGRDTLEGGAGPDVFDFNAVHQSPPDAPDLIADFVHRSDRIDLSTIDVPGGENGAFVFAGENAGVLPNSVTWHEAGGQTLVQLDNDGDTTADMAIALAGTGLGLTGGDFVL